MVSGRASDRRRRIRRGEQWRGLSLPQSRLLLPEGTGRGPTINIASNAARKGTENFFPYVTPRAGVIDPTRAIVRERGLYGIEARRLGIDIAEARCFKRLLV